MTYVDEWRSQCECGCGQIGVTIDIIIGLGTDGLWHELLTECADRLGFTVCEFCHRWRPINYFAESSACLTCHSKLFDPPSGDYHVLGGVIGL